MQTSKPYAGYTCSTYRTIKRLLQPGAATYDILQQYVSTIKVLRYLDPPGVLLYGVAEPIRRYLRSAHGCFLRIASTYSLFSSSIIPLLESESDPTRSKLS
jgi:hypothetical protein